MSKNVLFNENFSIIMPPPNVTGSLHMGHALTYTIQDVLIRYAKLLKKNVWWQAGFDHAGIATQMLAEKELQSQGKSKNDMTREEFLNFIFSKKDDSIKNITNQINLLNMDVDWTYSRFTLDEMANKAVIKCFVQLYNEGLIYRDKKIVNWDPCLQTTISDLEVINKECKGKLYYLRYWTEDLKNFIDIATTRPETIFGDVAVAVNSQDERYKKFHGQTFIIPIINRAIPMICDDYVDSTFGTGVLKVTPAHDQNDFEIGARHNLEIIDILDDAACLNHNTPKDFVGLTREEARKKVVLEAKNLNLLVQEEDITHFVPHGDRSGTIIEQKLTTQWFLNVSEMAKDAIECVKNGNISFTPKHWVSTYENWLKDIQPWCISRQLVWGHQIPAWYDKNDNIFVAESEEEVQNLAECNLEDLRRDENVLDTWFSSALWAFSSLGWPENTNLLKDFLPSSVLVTGFDIIFFWVARMVMMTRKFTNSIPFKNILICPIVCDNKGQKMSKTKGNVINPLDIINKYSSDALRIALVSEPLFMRHIRFDEKKVELARNFLTKIQNALKFCENSLFQKDNLQVDNLQHVISDRHVIKLSDNENDCETTEDKILFHKHDISHLELNSWILNKSLHCKENFDVYMNKLEIHLAFNILKKFILNDFCDCYIELVKPYVHLCEVKEIMIVVVQHMMELIALFAPYFAKEKMLEWKEKYMIDFNDQINIQDLEKTDDIKKIDLLIQIISDIRSMKGLLNSNESWSEIYIKTTEPIIEIIEKYRLSFERIAKVKIKLFSINSINHTKNTDFSDNFEIKIDTNHKMNNDLLTDAISLSNISSNYGIINIFYQKALLTQDRIDYLHKRFSKLENEMQIIKNNLENEKFIANSDETTIQDLKIQLNDNQEKLEKISFAMDALNKLS